MESPQKFSLGSFEKQKSMQIRLHRRIDTEFWAIRLLSMVEVYPGVEESKESTPFCRRSFSTIEEPDYDLLRQLITN